MARSKSKQATNGVKRDFAEDAPVQSSADRPAKKTKLLDDSDDEADADDGGVSLRINEDYARRFEHNKKREEQHRCKWHGLDQSIHNADHMQWKKSMERKRDCRNMMKTSQIPRRAWRRTTLANF